MIESRSCQFCLATALTGGVLAALLAPAAAQTAECGVSFEQTITPPGLAASTVTFPGLTIGLASAIGSAVTTVDAALQAQGASAFVVATPTPAPDQQGGGVWARAVGGNFLTSVPVAGSTSLAAPLLAPGMTATSPINCQSRVREEFNGVQVGADVARLNVGGGGGTFHVGLTSGRVATSGLTNSSSTNLDFQVPFFGLYASLTYGNSYGNFFADAQIRGNFLLGSLTDSQNAIFGQKVNGRGFTVSGNIGYQYNNLPDHWFIEPSAGVNWSRTFIDPVNLSTTTTLGQLPAFPSFPGLDFSNVRIASFDNLTGRASIRVGTTFQVEQMIFQPFATASVLHEFADPISSQVNTLDVAPGGGFFLQSGLFSTARIGTYGQFGLGTAAQIADSGWTSFVRGDYRVGSRFNGWSVAGGARYSFNPEVGVAREGRSAEPAAAPAPYNWSGFFVGASAPGALWGDTNWSSANIHAGRAAKYAGVLAGGGGGYNYQFGPLVVGGQVEWDWSNARGGNSFSCPGDFGGFDFPSRATFRRNLSLSSFGCEARVNSILTATGRLGYAWDRLLIYGQGGLAAGDIAAKSVSTVTTLTVVPLSPTVGTVVSVPATASASKTTVGWTVGAGVEFGLTQNISAKAEYLYFDLGSDTYNLGVPVAINRTGNIGRVGLNYRFNLM